MVVDDAIVVRGLIARWIEAEPDLRVVASLRSGREAIEQVERTDPDVVVLDVDMPDIDGITALPRLLEKKRDLVVLMASTLTRRNAEVSLRALSLGAADYIPKPQTNREFASSPGVPPRADRQGSRARRPPQAARRRPALRGRPPGRSRAPGRASRRRARARASPSSQPSRRAAASRRADAGQDRGCGRSR